MNFGAVFFRIMLVALLGLACTGCWEDTGNDLDELKDPYVVRGKSLVKSSDYPGAVEAYGKALEVNPSNATAHFELFWLYKEKVIDYAAAIYHGERYLKLRPKASNEEVVKQHILGCKQELVRSLPLGPVTPALLRDFERLSHENKQLRLQVEQLIQKVAFLSTNRPYLPPPSTPAPSADTPRGAADRPPAELPRAAPTAGSALRGQVVTRAAGASRTHSVKPGETLTRIARQHGVRMSAVTSANPGLDPRRIKAGQVIKIP